MYEVKRKRKKGFVYFLILFLCAFAVGLGIGYGGVRLGLLGEEPEPNAEEQLSVYTGEEEETPVPDRQASAGVAEEPEPTATQAPREQSYFVIEEAGRVCVFAVDEQGEKRFSHNLSIELEALRPEDQQLFKEGITVHTREELLSLMEDFSS